MFEIVKGMLKATARRCGVDVHRWNAISIQRELFCSMLQLHKIDTVLDVGANTGQFGLELRKGGYTGHIVSFEPLESARGLLLNRAQHDRLWTVAPIMAIGDAAGTLQINVSANSQSSSILPMSAAHVDAAPESQFISSQTVEVRRLDDAAEPYVTNESRIFIKCDTQGYEDKVLAGAQSLLQRAVGIQLEMSSVQLYAGQKTLDVLLQDIFALGFELWGAYPVFADPKSGRLLQLDVLAFRRTV